MIVLIVCKLPFFQVSSENQKHMTDNTIQAAKLDTWQSLHGTVPAILESVAYCKFFSL